MKNYLIPFLLTALLLSSCSKNTLPQFNATDQPPAPDYTNPKHWSALPFRTDAPDAVPHNETFISDSLKDVDVFYVYPTLYAKGETWNAPLDKKKLNKRIDKFPVKFQASPFNKVGRVYAPRYRQANIKAYSDTTENGKQALNYAYADVKRAFEYYLHYYNNGRPIIIASHSQGSTHCRQLLKDFFDTPETKQKLVCAYVVGIAIDGNKYELLKPCATPNETNCYVTWATFKEGYNYHGKFLDEKTKAPLELLAGNVVINPLSWNTDNAAYTGKGGILLNLKRKKPFNTHAHIHENVLWVKTNMPLARKWDNLHIFDYNLFWHNIRSNAATRVENYLQQYSVK
jgi:hypothetical protein